MITENRSVDYSEFIKSISDETLIRTYDIQMKNRSILLLDTMDEVQRRIESLDREGLEKFVKLLDVINFTPAPIVTPLPHRWYTPIMNFLLGK